MALSFPPAPTIGDIYTSGGKSWEWDGTSWNIVSLSGLAAGGDLAGAYPNPTIAADAVGTAEIAADAVGSSEIATDAVGTAEIAADAVTNAELANMAAGTVKMRETGSGTGDPTDSTLAVLAAEAAFTGRYGPSDVMSLPYYRAAPHQTSSATAAVVGASITSFVALPIPEPCTLTSIQVEVTTGTALSAGRVGAYSINDGRDPANGLTLLSDFGTVDMTVTQIVNTAGSVNCAGLRWIVLACWVPATNPPMRIINTLSGNGSIAAALGGMPTPAQARHVQGWRITATDYSAGLPASPSPTVQAGGGNPIVYIKGLFTYP